MKRRDFLKASVLATAALTSTPLTAQAKTEKPKVKRYQEIGKTGLRMSDISYGTGRLPSASMILRDGSSEKYIGQAMKSIQRDKVIIASKFCTSFPYPSHLTLDSKKKDYIDAVEGSLSRMKTDYLDICFVHAIGEQNKDREEEEKRLFSNEMLESFEELKKAGKVRFLAVSSHGPNNMEDLLLRAVKSGNYDLIMPSFNFMKFPQVPDILKEAKKRGVGVVAMKTLAGAKDSGVSSKDKPFEPAAFKWVLSHPEVNGLVISIKSVSDLDLYLTASGEKFTAGDQRILNRYAQQFGREYCRTGCNKCESACPESVAIATTLRYNMYFKDYGNEKNALESYARLDEKAENCASCQARACTSACPYGLPVNTMLSDAHENLSFTV
jgi:predicted aldo/keto reductase-like oxidoreductase